MSSDPQQIAAKLYAAGLASDKKPLRGCSDSDIEKIENRFGVKLPTVYKHFLSVMGRDTAYFLNYCIVTYPDIFYSFERVTSLLEESDLEIGDSAFAFLNTDNQILYFDTKAGLDDPPVYGFTEGEDKPEKVAVSFSSWLEETANLEIDSFDKDAFEKSLAKHNADPLIQKREDMKNKSKFRQGDKVLLAKEVTDIETRLGDESETSFAKGQKAVVQSVEWDEEDNDYYYAVEISNEANTELIGVPILPQEVLEPVHQ